MKIKSMIIMGLLVLTLLSVSTIYADTVNIGDSTFSMPEGYTLVEKDNQLVMYNDTVAMTIYEGPILDPSEAKQKRVNMGYELIGERNYTYANADINQQNYYLEGVYSCVYTLEKKQ